MDFRAILLASLLLSLYPQQTHSCKNLGRNLKIAFILSGLAISSLYTIQQYYPDVRTLDEIIAYDIGGEKESELDKDLRLNWRKDYLKKYANVTDD